MKEPDNISEIDIIKGMDQAMINSYDIIIGNTTVEELLLESNRKAYFFAHNVEVGPTQNDIKSIKDYFEKMEDYERCIELSDMIIGD
jgi:hypothetical protein